MSGANGEQLPGELRAVTFMAADARGRVESESAVYYGMQHPDARPGGFVLVGDRPDLPGVGVPLHHWVKHSPDGFAWGYGGSGPADLARSLLADALGGRAICGECTYDGLLSESCGRCDAGLMIAPAYVQEFKRLIIEALPDEFALPRAHVLQVYEQIGAGDTL